MSNPYHILLAEDDLILGELLVDRLKMEGWTVDWAKDGEAASEKLLQPYDAMILDIMMPKRDGFAVLSDAQARQVKFPIVVASNLNDTKQLSQAKQLGAADILIKSDLDLDVLVEKITQVIASYGQPAA